MPLPKNFTFYIGGRDEIKYFADREINYFIAFNFPNWTEPYTYDYIYQHYGHIEDLYFFNVHDAFTKDHRLQGCKMPDKELMLDILKHAEIIKRRLDNGEQVNAFFGCAAGKSRSTAACYVILCYLLGEWNEREALNLLVNKRPIARPNALMVKIADDLMERGYKMVSPLHNALDLERETEDDGLLLF